MIGLVLLQAVNFINIASGKSQFALPQVLFYIDVNRDGH